MLFRSVKAGQDLVDTLLEAGMRLQREAQQQVPVDTSALKASAFTCLESDLETRYVSSRWVAERSENKKLNQRKVKALKKAAKASAARARQRGRKK